MPSLPLRSIFAAGTALLLAGCSSSPDPDTVVDRRGLQLAVNSEAVQNTNLTAEAVYWGDDRVTLNVGNPWDAEHRFTHPMLEHMAAACSNERPDDHWIVTDAELRDDDTVAETLVNSETALPWRDLGGMELPGNTSGDETLHVTLRFNDNRAAVNGEREWRVRAGGSTTRLHSDLEARVVGISRVIGRAMVDGELMETRYLEVELRNTGNSRYTLDTGRSGGGINDELISMNNGQQDNVPPRSRSVVEVPVSLPDRAERRLGEPTSLQRVPLNDMHGFQWNGPEAPLGRHHKPAAKAFNASAYLVLRDHANRERTGFADATVVMDRRDTVNDIRCR